MRRRHFKERDQTKLHQQVQGWLIASAVLAWMVMVALDRAGLLDGIIR